MMAIMWKEWQESKRAFVGGLMILLGLPAVLVVYFILADDEWLFGFATYLTVLFAPLIAAVWGAHIVCKDVTTGEGRFLFAQPIHPSKVIVAKLGVAVPLLLLLMIVPAGIDLIGYLTMVYVPSDWDAWETEYLVGLYASGALLMVPVLAAAALAAVLLKRLVPATLAGLVVAALLIFGPHMWFSFEGLVIRTYPAPAGWLSRNWQSLIGAPVAIVVGVPMMFAACVAARRPERPPLALKPLAWFGVTSFLAGTWFVTGALGNNTVVTTAIAPQIHAAPSADRYYSWYSEPPLIWSERNSLYWLGIHTMEPAVKRCAHRFLQSTHVETATIDAEGLIATAPRIASDARVADLPSHAHVGDLLYRYVAKWARRAESERQLEVYRYSEGIPVLIETVALGRSIRHVWCAVDVQEKTLTVSQPSNVGASSSLYRLDISDPEHPRIRFTSQPYPMPSTPMSRLFQLDGGCSMAMRDDMLAVASPAGLWLYRLDASGAWNLLGFRPASILEIIAGGSPERIIWKQDHVYVCTYSFGLLVYDVSDPSRPCRIAHSGTNARDIAVLDNGIVAVLTTDNTIQIHKLPE